VHKDNANRGVLAKKRGFAVKNAAPADGTIAAPSPRNEEFDVSHSALDYPTLPCIRRAAPVVVLRHNAASIHNVVAADVWVCAGFSDTCNHETIHVLRRQASEKRQGTKSRAGRGSRPLIITVALSVLCVLCGLRPDGRA
jgi:hypothetical protein